MAKVLIPSPLRSYTKSKSQLEIAGETLGQVLATLDSTHPGILFRMVDEQSQVRDHIKFFVDTIETKDFNQKLRPDSTLHIVCALSGG